MLLTELEAQRYRSIEQLSDETAVDLRGLDCLVGKNNAGKTNIMSAAKFLLDEEDEKDEDEELFWQRETTETVVVRGFFEVSEEDLQRVPEEKREKVRDKLIDRGEHEGQLGICKRAEFEDGSGVDTETRLLQLLPAGDHYSESSFVDTRNKKWKRAKNDDDFTKTDYRDEMQEEYPEVADDVPDGKLKQKEGWKDGYDEYVNSYPDGLEYELQSTKFDGTKTIILSSLLPQVVSIPAIKPVDSTTNKRGEFGSLISEISTVIGDEIDREIQDLLDDFNIRNNETVQTVEERVTERLGAAFENQSVHFEFPELSAQYLFDDADIQIDDEQIESLSKENVGEGVKRTLIFSLVRTLADIREGELLSEEEDGSDRRPLLLCYEEADLFLHPSLQKQLVQTFEEFVEGDSQVLFSTHSPVMVQNEPLDTINIVRKEAGATTVTQFHEKLRCFDEGEQSRLTDLQSVSSYVFADTVVLVEGESDQIVFRKLSERFGPQPIETSSVPLLAAGGKGEVEMFYKFLNKLGIETHAVLDIDVLYRGDDEADIESTLPDEDLPALDRLVKQVNRQHDGPERAYNKDDIPDRTKNKPWSETFDHLEGLVDRVTSGEEANPEDMVPIQRVLDECDESNSPPKHLWTSDRVESDRVALVETLLERNILVLCGDLEDYYPYDGGNKRVEALEFDPDEHDKRTLRENFQSLGETTDVERFLNSVLSDK